MVFECQTCTVSVVLVPCHCTTSIGAKMGCISAPKCSCQALTGPYSCDHCSQMLADMLLHTANNHSHRWHANAASRPNRDVALAVNDSGHNGRQQQRRPSRSMALLDPKRQDEGSQKLSDWPAHSSVDVMFKPPVRQQAMHARLRPISKGQRKHGCEAWSVSKGRMMLRSICTKQQGLTRRPCQPFTAACLRRATCFACCTAHRALPVAATTAQEVRTGSALPLSHIQTLPLLGGLLADAWCGRHQSCSRRHKRGLHAQHSQQSPLRHCGLGARKRHCLVAAAAPNSWHAAHSHSWPTWGVPSLLAAQQVRQQSHATACSSARGVCADAACSTAAACAATGGCNLA